MIGSIREYFLLTDARATAKLVPEDARVALHDKLALGRQRSEAADALWSNGHVAEGLRLAAEAFDATLEAFAPFEGAVPPAADRDANAGEIGEAETILAPAPDEKGEEADDEANAESEAEASASQAASEEEKDDEPSDAAESPAMEPVALRSDRRPEEPSWAAILRRRGLSEGKTREVLEAERTLRGRTLPRLDRDVTSAEGELFQALITARRHIDRVLAPASMTPKQLSWTRASRIGFTGFIAALAVVGLYVLLKPATGVEATASGHYNPDFVADKVIDGNEGSEWLLPDRQAGWLELRITPPEAIETLRLKNSHNRHYNDRATREYTIEVYSNGQVARTIEGEFPTLSPRPDWVEHAVGVEDVERVRINVRSWHRNGGGLAEIEWD